LFFFFEVKKSLQLAIWVVGTFTVGTPVVRGAQGFIQMVSDHHMRFNLREAKAEL
jgi:hypothetical protein